MQHSINATALMPILARPASCRAAFCLLYDMRDIAKKDKTIRRLQGCLADEQAERRAQLKRKVAKEKTDGHAQSKRKLSEEKVEVEGLDDLVHGWRGMASAMSRFMEISMNPTALSLETAPFKAEHASQKPIKARLGRLTP